LQILLSPVLANYIKLVLKTSTIVADPHNCLGIIEIWGIVAVKTESACDSGDYSAREWPLTAYRSVRTNSTRRLSARPCSVELSPFGWVGPRPAVCRRCPAMPRLIKAAATALARAAESF
jgi:hypothetical protein